MQTSPEALPETSPQALPETLPEALPEESPNASPEARDPNVLADARLRYVAMLDLVIGQGGTILLADGSTAHVAAVTAVAADQSAVLVAGLETPLGMLEHATLRGCDIESVSVRLLQATGSVGDVAVPTNAANFNAGASLQRR
jgi:hypothetical protein